MLKSKIGKLSFIAAGAILFLALVSCRNPFFPHDALKDSAGGAQIIPLSMAPPDTSVWARSVGSSDLTTTEAEFKSVAVDQAGSAYAVGSQKGSSAMKDFFYAYGDIKLHGWYSHTPVYVKYNAAGKEQWAKTVTPALAYGQGFFYSVAVDNAGNSFVAGALNGEGIWNFGNGVKKTIDIGTTPVLIKYDASGNAKWASVPSIKPVYAQFNSVAIAPDGSIYAAGYQVDNGAYDYGDGTNPLTLVSGTTSSNEGVCCPILVKYNSNGIAQWVVSTIESPGIAMYESVAVDGAGNVYVTGSQDFDNETYTYSPGVTIDNGNIGQKPLLIKYNSSGALIWLRTLDSGPFFWGAGFRSVAVDRDGYIYVAGAQSYSGTYDYGNAVTLTGPSGYLASPVLIQYDADGNALWGRTTIDDSLETIFNSVAVSPDGGVFVAGKHEHPVESHFGNGVSTKGTNDFANPIIVKYDVHGDALWAKSTTETEKPSEGLGNFVSVAASSNGSVFAVG